MNGCPNHPYKVVRPSTTPRGTPTAFSVPLLPSISSAALTSSVGSKDLSAQEGGVGLLFNGALVFSAYSTAYGGYGSSTTPSPATGPQYNQTTSYTTTAAYAEGFSFDQCGCHAAPSKAFTPLPYHYQPKADN